MDPFYVGVIKTVQKCPNNILSALHLFVLLGVYTVFICTVKVTERGPDVADILNMSHFFNGHLPKLADIGVPGCYTYKETSGVETSQPSYLFLAGV